MIDVIQTKNKIIQMSFKFLPRQPHKSPAQFIRTSRKSFNINELSSKFVPFVQERDGLGRLIKAKPTHEEEMPEISLNKQNSNEALQTELSHNPSKNHHQLQEKIDQVQDIINREFQYKHTQGIKSFSKNKIGLRKNSLQIPTRKQSEDEIFLPKIKQTEQDRHAEHPKIRKGSEVTAYTQPGSPLLRKNTSLVEVKSVRKTSLNDIEFLHHEVICNKSPQKVPKEKVEEKKSKVLLQQIEHKTSEPKITFSEQYLTNKIQNRQISQLNRYNTFKTLSLKLSSNLDQGHSTFMNKMRQTKKLAYKLKISLEST